MKRNYIIIIQISYGGINTGVWSDAGISLNGAVFGALLRPLDVKKKSGSTEGTPRDKNFVDRLKEKVQRQPKSKENGDAGHHPDIVLVSAAACSICIFAFIILCSSVPLFV